MFALDSNKEQSKVEINLTMPCVSIQSSKNHLAVAPVRLYNRQTGVHVDTYCLIDHGAMRDVCSQALTHVLNLAVNPL